MTIEEEEHRKKERWWRDQGGQSQPSQRGQRIGKGNKGIEFRMLEKVKPPPPPLTIF